MRSERKTERDARDKTRQDDNLALSRHHSLHLDTLFYIPALVMGAIDHRGGNLLCFTIQKWISVDLTPPKVYQ